MTQAEAVILALLDQRGSGKTICPSQAARKLAGPGGDWRCAMPEVHAAVDALMAQDAIRLAWQGAAKSERRGPYRIARRS